MVTNQKIVWINFFAPLTSLLLLFEEYGTLFLVKGLVFPNQLVKLCLSIAKSILGDCSILVCPGFCNSSEKKYVRAFVQYAMDKGFRVFVLNHVGSLSSVKLTSPKVFTYGMVASHFCV